MEKRSFDRPSKYERKPKKFDEFTIFGIRAVIEAIAAERELNKILIQKGMKNELFQELKQALKGKEYPLQFVPAEKFSAYRDKNHQGVVAFASPVTYFDIEQLADEYLTSDRKLCVLALDRITDVRNFGAIARTAECMGVDAILIPSKGSAQVTPDAVKTSAGALSRMKVCKTDDLKNSLFYLQQSGMRLVACTEKSPHPLHMTNLRGNVAIILGSEEDGITNDLINMADVDTKIPMQGKTASLNVSVAAGMVLYERIRQNS